MAKQWRHEREHVAVAAAAERAPLALLADILRQEQLSLQAEGDEPAGQAKPVFIGRGPRVERDVAVPAPAVELDVRTARGDGRQ